MSDLVQLIDRMLAYSTQDPELKDIMHEATNALRTDLEARNQISLVMGRNQIRRVKAEHNMEKLQSSCERIVAGENDPQAIAQEALSSLEQL